MIAFGVKTEQLQAKAIFTAGGSMAAAIIATGLHENRHDILTKTNGWIDLAILHNRRDLNCMASIGHFDLSRAIGNRKKG